MIEILRSVPVGSSDVSGSLGQSSRSQGVGGRLPFVRFPEREAAYAKDTPPSVYEIRHLAYS